MKLLEILVAGRSLAIFTIFVVLVLGQSVSAIVFGKIYVDVGKS